MTPETIALIKELSLNFKDIAIEAIKILGTAAIAAFATYRAAKIQFDIKLKELQSTTEFGAREHMFKYYTDRQDKLNNSYEKLSESLGCSLGHASGFVMGAGEEGANESKEYLKMWSGFADFYAKTTPSEIDITARDMEKNGLKDTPEYERLIAYKDQISSLVQENTIESFRNCIYSVLEVLHCLQQCNQSILEKRIEEVFETYYQPERTR